MSQRVALLVAATALLASTPALAREPGPYDVKQESAGAPLPKGVKAKGATVEQVWSWTENDLLAKGYAVFSSTEKKKDDHLVERKIYVQIYSGKPGKLKQTRLVQDHVLACEFDVTAKFVDGSVTITDEDGDGKWEIAFAYDLACRSDVSPATRKLLVIEGGAKHALRGTERVDVGNGEKVGGEYKADGFAKEAAVKAYAVAQWAALLAKPSF